MKTVRTRLRVAVCAGHVSGWASAPGCEGGGEAGRAVGLGPGDVAVRPNQHGAGGVDLADDGKRPVAVVLGSDSIDPVRPGLEVGELVVLELEQDRSSRLQQLADAARATGYGEVEVGHAATKQRVAVAEGVVDVQAGHEPGDAVARLV